MTAGTNSAPSSPAELLGDVHPLLDQLGSAEDLAVASTVADAFDLRRVADRPSLRNFLQSYRSQILVPIELPAIVSAFGHAARGQLIELLALDQEQAQNVTLRKFAPASCRVGQRQLSKLRPMRDQRLVQRYLSAIEEGRARGWHTLVYGVSLAMFSLPLRQGLQNYIEKTVRGFIYSSAKSLRLSEADCLSLDGEQQLHVPPAIDLALQEQALPFLAASAKP
ncbi:MAG TPA: urease accessory UreF family protein [Candidatus Limnocylindria bacterium]|nr:urease accessory UreF family protein [Candidatus Limnocylindria bacterium]